MFVFPFLTSVCVGVSGSIHFPADAEVLLLCLLYLCAAPFSVCLLTGICVAPMCCSLNGAAVDIGGEGNGTPLQSSCLENPMDGGAW